MKLVNNMDRPTEYACVCSQWCAFKESHTVASVFHNNCVGN